MSDLHLTGLNNANQTSNNNNNNNGSQEFTLCKLTKQQQFKTGGRAFTRSERASSSSDSSSDVSSLSISSSKALASKSAMVSSKQQVASESHQASSKKLIQSHHLSHNQLGQQANISLPSHHYHSHLQMTANLMNHHQHVSASQIQISQQQNKQIATKSTSGLIIDNGVRQKQQEQPLQQQQQQQQSQRGGDRSDSASLTSSTSTSESMFKRRLGSPSATPPNLTNNNSLTISNEDKTGDSKWHKLLPCGNSQDSSSSSSPKATRFTPLLLLFAFLILIVIAMLLFHFKLFGLSISCSYYATSKPSDGFNLKNGAEFYLGITEMLQAMDNTVDPCHDFYNYACGAWTRRHSIPGDESRIDTFSVMRSDLGNKLKDLLEEDIDLSSDCEATVKAKTLYKSCVNESQIDNRGPEPLIELLNSQFGGWPLLGDISQSYKTIGNNNLDWSSSITESSTLATSNNATQKMDWVQMMAVLRTYNNEIIIGQTVGSHEHNSSMHAIRLYPAGLGLPSADYYNSSSRQFKAYEKYLISTAQLLKANNSNLLSDIRDILEFETGLANISKPFERQGGATYHRMTISRLQKYTPAIDWDTYFKYSFPDISINSTEQVGLYGLDFFMDIAHLINTTASKKTVINYLLWRFVMNRVNNLGKQFANNQHEYAAEISGAKNQAPRHKVCVDYVNGNMGMAVSSLYVKKHFDTGSKVQAEIMISNIRQAFLDILEQVDWMDLETRTEAIVKAKSMLQHIGFPLWIIDPNQLDSEYLHLNFSSEHYFENVIQLIKSFAKETRVKLREPSERDKWTVAPSIINAHYLRTKNLMSFPAGILQPPIYHTRYPKSLNYGGIGSIIGHEITHGFDNDGRHHDFQGNQRLWWHPNTIDRFIIRSQCMVKQYDDYNVEIRGENVTVSGIRTLGENIADNGGLKEAFMAYRHYELENGPEDSLPGLNLTHHQMFFIKFAQNWCQNMTPQSMMNALKTWRHPLGRFRVIGTLSNLNEFSTAFNCLPDTPMNPVNKCKVW